MSGPITQFTPIQRARSIEELSSQTAHVSEREALPSATERTAGIARAFFDKIVTFGDSLSDSGNAYSLWNQETVAPYATLDELLVPTYPYAHGGHHYCNGPTWIELFSRALGLIPSGQASFLEPKLKHTNFAVGRARARNVNDPELFNLPAQVTEYLKRDIRETEGHSTLYAIEIGANDIRDALMAPPGVEKGPSKILDEALDGIDTSVKKLYEKGARKFLVWTIPDIGKTPTLRALDSVHPGIAQATGNLTNAFNSGIKTHLKALSTLSGITILELDAHRKFDQMIASPQEYGLRDITSSFVQRNEAPRINQNPDEYMFWDGIHPTERFHKVIAEEAILVTNRK